MAMYQRFKLMGTEMAPNLSQQDKRSWSNFCKYNHSQSNFAGRIHTGELTRLNWGSTRVVKVEPIARDAITATGMNLGKLGSIIPEAASPVASTAKSGKRMEGLSKEELPSFAGALNSSDSRPSLWFVKQIGSPA